MWSTQCQLNYQNWLWFIFNHCSFMSPPHNNKKGIKTGIYLSKVLSSHTSSTKQNCGCKKITRCEQINQALADLHLHSCKFLGKLSSTLYSEADTCMDMNTCKLLLELWKGESMPKSHRRSGNVILAYRNWLLLTAKLKTETKAHRNLLAMTSTVVTH